MLKFQEKTRMKFEILVACQFSPRKKLIASIQSITINICTRENLKNWRAISAKLLHESCKNGK